MNFQYILLNISILFSINTLTFYYFLACFRFCIMAGTEGYNQQTGGVSSTIPLAEELRGDLNKIIFNVSKLKSVLVGSKVINELETQLKNFSLVKQLFCIFIIIFSN